MTGVIDTLDPLTRSYRPATFVDREAELETLSQAFAADTDTHLQHLHVFGPRGTGKTHLLQHFLTTFPPTVTTCYVSGRPYDTQYKVLERLLERLTGEQVGPGHHVAALQRQVREVVTLPTVIVLDEVDFLLLNDGDDLLYFLSRLDHVAVITVSATHRSLAGEVDARTYSSFHPQELTLNPYTQTETTQILADRVRQALLPQSLERAALTTIASTTSNIAIGVTWLRVAAEAADQAITQDLVATMQDTGYYEYVLDLLADFTPHHRRLYDTIDVLAQEEPGPFVTGSVYAAYVTRCEDVGVTPLSERRISDFITHLELLDLIEATYHYGGSKGKTREIQLVVWQDRSDSEELG